MNDTMTVKELAEVASVNPRTIYRAVKKLHFDIHRGVEARFDHEQCLRIVGVITANQKNVQVSKVDRTAVQPSQNGKVPRQIAEVMKSHDRITSELLEQNAELIKTLSVMMPAMMKIADACQTMAEKVQSVPVIAPPEQEYSTVSGYCRRNGIRVDLETAKRFGKIATALSVERGYPIRKISDERWGEVNAYHVSVLAQAVAA